MQGLHIMSDEIKTTGIFADIFNSMTHEEKEDFRRICEEAEAPCAICRCVILCGGCPSKHINCPQFQGHKR